MLCALWEIRMYTEDRLLTDGADCSGFVMAVYRHFGITMAHDAGVQRTYGKEVSLAAAQPGDLVCFYGHIGIYIGGGQIVHAVNEGMGIAVTRRDIYRSGHFSKTHSRIT